MSTTPVPVVPAEVTKALGGKSLTAVLKTLAVKDAAPPEVPKVIPVPAVITDDEHAAIARLPGVFAKVVPTEARKLTTEELRALLDERETLDTIATMAETRKQNLRTTVLNHFDRKAEEEERTEGADRDKDGHYVLDQGEVIEGTAKKFTFETRDGTVNMDPAALEALADDDRFPEFTHKDFLAMTTQTRVVDDVKVLGLLRKRPELLRVIAEATTRGRRSAQFWVRKA